MLLDDYLQTIGPEINKLPIICSVIAGGSYSYKYSLYKSLSEIRDLDLLIFVQTRNELTDLLTVYQKDLDRILHLETVDKHFSREDLAPIIEGYVDAIRYSGYNELGQKISAKIIAYDHINVNTKTPTRINVLSKKDKRYYAHKTTSGNLVSVGIVNQQCGHDLCILGDQDLIPIGEEFALGVISDICLSGRVLYNSPFVNINLLKAVLIEKIINTCEIHGFPHKWSDILIRSDRLPQDFEDSFNHQFSQFSKIKNSAFNTKDSFTEYGISIVNPIIGGHYTQFELKKKVHSIIKEKRYVNSSGPFSSNSKYGLVVYETGEKAFFKEMLNEDRFRGELLGLITVSGFFNKLRSPIFTEPEKFLVSYDWFPGDILSRTRLEEISENNFGKIMELELRRAEDHLNAYIRSSVYATNNPKTLYFSRINDLFYHRLKSSRITDYYQKTSLVIGGDTLPFNQVKTMRFVINGVEYPSVNEIIERSLIYLDPDFLKKSDLICGLGDAHSGNIVCSNNLDSYNYVDYEFAGFHSPYLDIAKQLYNDTAFNLLYSDVISPIKKDFIVEVKNGKIVINHHFVPDKLSAYLFKTKMEGIIKPYQNYCEANDLPFNKDWKNILGSALFCCGLLTRNISDFTKDDFLMNLVNSIEASDFENYSNKFNI